VTCREFSGIQSYLYLERKQGKLSGSDKVEKWFYLRVGCDIIMFLNSRMIRKLCSDQLKNDTSVAYSIVSIMHVP